MLKIKHTKKFAKDYKLAQKRGLNIKRLTTVIEILSEEKPLPQRYKDHALRDTPEYTSVRECHIQSDWLLVYRVEKEIQILRLIRTGAHSDLF